MPNENVFENAAVISNPAVKKIAERVAYTAMLAAEKVVAEPDFQPEEGSFEQLFYDRLAYFDNEKRLDIQTRALELYEAPAEVRTRVFGELGNLAMQDIDNVMLAVENDFPLSINPAFLGVWQPPHGVELSPDVLERIRASSGLINEDETLSSDAISGLGTVSTHLSNPDSFTDNYPQLVSSSLDGNLAYNKLSFYIRKITCVKKSSWWEPGGDDIAISGAYIDMAGKTRPIGRIYVGDDYFYDGVTKWYTPELEVCSLDLAQNSTWPKSVFINLAMAELDIGGGFADFVEKLWKMIESAVKKVIATTVGAAIGGGFGSAFGPAGTALGAAIGAAIAWASVKIFEWLINLLDDDLFKPQPLKINIPNANGWNGSRYSPIGRAHFFGDDEGHYLLEYRAVLSPAPSYESSQNTINTAITWPNGKAYFFQGNQYKRYDFNRSAVDRGYPRNTAKGWRGFPSRFANGADAALLWKGNKKAYFFKGDQYIRFNVKADKVDSGYPVKISKNWGNWPSYFTHLDAAILWPEKAAYFFQDDEYIRYNISKDRVDAGYPRKIAKNWDNWPSSFADGVDAALVREDTGKIYFFKGNYYLRYDMRKDRVDEDYPRMIQDAWRGLLK